MKLPLTQVIKDTHTVQSTWTGDMHFVGDVQGHEIHMDKLPLHGGNDHGPRPKPFMLLATSGCAGLEVVSILKKMKVEPQSFRIEVSGTVSMEIPKVYTAIHSRYIVGCENADREKIMKAIDLVEEKYCGVIAMIKKFASYTSEIEFNMPEK